MFPEKLQAGFSVVAAIFLLVVLAVLAVIIASVTGIQQASSQLDVLGVRAYHAARTGMEWGAYQVLDPGNTVACPNLPVCPVSPQNLPALAGSLSGLTVTVECTPTANTTEGNRRVSVYSLQVTACSQADAGTGFCPNANPPAEYVERQLQASLSKCKDPTVLPGCECG